jgi:hypothetical protein
MSVFSTAALRQKPANTFTWLCPHSKARVQYPARCCLADQSDSGPINGVAGNPGYSVSPGFTALMSSLM